MASEGLAAGIREGVRNLILTLPKGEKNSPWKISVNSFCLERCTWFWSLSSSQSNLGFLFVLIHSVKITSAAHFGLTLSNRAQVAVGIHG